jgi:hypothetical protein
MHLTEVYMAKIEDLIELSKSAQRLFFALTRNVDEHNRILGKWNTFTEDPADNISKAKKELQQAEFIGKIGKYWVLNPYVVLPKYQRPPDQDSQYEVQKIWTRELEDANAYYDGIEQDKINLFGPTKPQINQN